MTAGPDLTGRLVRLRRAGLADVPRMTELLQDERVTRYLDHWSDTPYTMERSLEFVTHVASSSDSVGWVVDALEDGAYIGNTSLDSINAADRVCSWGIWLGPPDRWGRGYATEACMLAVEHAFTTLGLHKVVLDVYAGNAAARRAYEKAGFVSEGVRRRHHWDGSRFVDVELMAVFDDNPLYAQPIARGVP